MGRILASVRGAWRLLKLLAAAVGYTSYLSLVARRVPPEECLRVRAVHHQRGCALILRILRIKVKVLGSLPDDRRLLIVSNHFGILDPFVLASVMPVASAAKAEIAHWPLAGWVAREFGVIFVERGRQRTVSRFIDDVQERMKSQVPVLVFPEGTTSADETVHPFKTGAFAALAELPGVRILPVYLRPLRINGEPVGSENRSAVTWAGGTETFTQNFLKLVRHRVLEMEVRIGEPLDAPGMDRKRLAREARERVVALRDAAAIPSARKSEAP